MWQAISILIPLLLGAGISVGTSVLIVGGEHFKELNAQVGEDLGHLKNSVYCLETQVDPSRGFCFVFFPRNTGSMPTSQGYLAKG